MIHDSIRANISIIVLNGIEIALNATYFAQVLMKSGIYIFLLCKLNID